MTMYWRSIGQKFKFYDRASGFKCKLNWYFDQENITFSGSRLGMYII